MTMHTGESLALFHSHADSFVITNDFWSGQFLWATAMNLSQVSCRHSWGSSSRSLLAFVYALGMSATIPCAAVTLTTMWRWVQGLTNSFETRRLCAVLWPHGPRCRTWLAARCLRPAASQASSYSVVSLGQSSPMSLSSREGEIYSLLLQYDMCSRHDRFPCYRDRLLGRVLYLVLRRRKKTCHITQTVKQHGS